MEWIRAAFGARQRLWLLLGVLAVALSLLAMHQLSSNHTAAGPPAAAVSVATDAAHLTLSSGAHADTPAADAGGTDHAHLTVASGDGHPASEDGGCPGCADHSAMALTCLAALVLLIGGWMLSRPRLGRGLWFRRAVPLLMVDRRSWVPRPRSLAELAISRT
ncbi:MAG: hypothetical protein L0H41_08700 [Microlunatus sp.]|nr:hypothetical protein [Microlunatus sp.]